MNKKPIIKLCPSCGNELSITKLSCKNCLLEISGDFDGDDFLGLNAEEKDFVKKFLEYEGNISSMQSLYKENYVFVKNKLRDINQKIGNLKEKIMVDMNTLVKTGEGLVTRTIKEKMISCNGLAHMPMLKGDNMEISLSENGDGIIASGFPRLIMKWDIFEEIVREASRLGGKMFKGDSGAQAGAKIGSKELPLESIDSFVALLYYDRQKGETTTRRSTYFAGVLDWAGIAKNNKSEGYGSYIKLNERFMNYSQVK